MYIARHGQTVFNVIFGKTRMDPGIIDPPLTEQGLQQAGGLAHTLSSHNIKQVISSPYTRALQTAWTVSAHLNVPLIVDPNVRERKAFICDIGTSATVLSRQWPDLDFLNLNDIWWNQGEEAIPAFHDRCANFRQSVLKTEKLANTVVITHWGVIRSLTCKLVGNCELLSCNPREPHPAVEAAWPKL